MGLIVQLDLRELVRGDIGDTDELQILEMKIYWSDIQPIIQKQIDVSDESGFERSDSMLDRFDSMIRGIYY